MVMPCTGQKDRHRAFRGSLDEALVALAGPIAEAASCGLDINDARCQVGNERHRSIYDGALGDWECAEGTIEDLLDHVSPETWSDGILARIEQHVEVGITSPLIWPHVIALAEKLMKKRTMHAHELRRLLAKLPRLDALREQCRRHLRRCLGSFNGAA